MHKKAGLNEMALEQVGLDLSIEDAEAGNRRRIAYERMLLDVLRGNSSLFVRRDEVEAAWQWIDAHMAPDATVAAVGFSQGGLMATQLLRTRPERVAATVVLSGFVQAAPQPADERLAARRPAVFWGRGARDPMIPADAIEGTRQWLTAHSTLTERVYPGLAHGIGNQEIADVRAFLSDPSLQGLFPGLPRIGVRVVGVRGDGAEISGAQVIDAPDQLELIRVRLIWTHVAIAGRLSDGPA